MRLFALLTLLAVTIAPRSAYAQAAVTTASGPVQGALVDGGKTRAFLGIPYAAPPVGELRWKAPQPVAAWKGVRPATEFGHHCLQFGVSADMVFRDAGPSEDCLTLNVWTPAEAKPTAKPLPVMVWIHGGGFTSGGSSEPRQDGQFLAARGVVVVSMNYRLGMLGFFTHPQLTAESPHHVSGNYGLLDITAALAWVKQNIRAFGGDPGNVTLFGESAGSFAVSMLMASPLSEGMLSKAIGESGAAFWNRNGSYTTLAVSEAHDAALAKNVLDTNDLAALRALPAEGLASHTAFYGSVAFAPTVDGYFLPDSPAHLYEEGKQAHIPLLAGWNADEIRASVVRGKTPTTAASFTAQMEKEFGDRAKQALAVFPAATDAEAIASAGDFAGDRFLVYATWHWIEAQTLTGDAPVYRYRFDLAAPPSKFHPAGSGAFHSDEIEYVFGTLDSRPGSVWRAEDRALSDQMQRYWTNFARTGDPNGPGLPKWPLYVVRPSNPLNAAAWVAQTWPVMHLDATSKASPDGQRSRYQFLDSVWANR
jgi:para-nitrobenzyl esterase